MSAQLNMQAAATLMAGLASEGVRRVVVSPGGRNTPLMLAASAQPALRVHVVLDERAAGFFALGLARASGAPVALACTSGSAGAHYLPAVIEAQQTRTPLVVCTADRPPELHGVGAPQTIEQDRLFGDFVVHRRALPAPGPGVPLSLWRIAAQAAVCATQAGPVHLNLPFREPLWAPGVEAPALPVREGAREQAPARVPTWQLARLAAWASGAARGVIQVGPHASQDPEFGTAITALAVALRWPVFAELASGARFGPGRVSAYDGLLRSSDQPGPDRVLRLGRASHSRAFNAWLQRDGVQVVSVDTGGRRQDPHGVVTEVVAAEPAAFARALAPLVHPGPVAWSTAWAAAEARGRLALDAAAHTQAIWGAVIAREVARTSGALHLGNSLSYRDLDAWIRPDDAPRRVFASRGVNGIDGTVATAAGEAAHAGPLVLVLGDLAFLHDLSGLLVVAAERPDLTIVVADNQGGGIFDHLPVAAHPDAFERCFVAAQAVDVGAFARAAGLPCAVASSRDALRAALHRAAAVPGPAVIHVPFDRAFDLAQHRAAWEAAR